MPSELMMETKDKKKGMMSNILSGLEDSWDHCKACKKALPPGSPTNKFYDEKLGSVTICVDCTMKAIMWYVRHIYGIDQPSEQK